MLHYRLKSHPRIVWVRAGRVKHTASGSVARVPTTSRGDTILSQPLPDLALLDAHGREFRLRQFVGQKPLVLFFYILNGSPG